MKYKKKLYVVSEFVDQRTNSTGYFWFKIIEILSSKFNDISVISTKKSCQLAAKDNQIPLNISIIHSNAPKETGFIAKLISNISLSIKFALKIITCVRRNDVVFSGTNPSTLVFFISLIKPISRFKWVLLVNDIFPDNLVPAKLSSKSSLIFKLTKRLFDYAYNRADKIIVIGRDMSDLVSKKTLGKTPITFIPNALDLEDFKIEENDTLLKDYKHGKKKIIFQFFGNMGIVQGLDIVLEAISLAKSKNVKFNFIGSGSGSSIINKFIDENPHLDLELFPQVPFEKNTEILKDCDVSIVSLASGMKGLAVPSKAFFSLAADKPIFVLGDTGGELDLLIKDNPKAGWFCDIGNKSHIAKKIDEIATCNLEELKGFPRQSIEKEYNFSMLSFKYVKLFKELMD